MYAASPQPASGALDPSIELSHLYAGGLRAVGVCVPRSSAEGVISELARIDLWQVGGDGTARRVDDAVVLDVPLYRAGEAYWAPPPGQGGLWPAGRYIFEIESDDGGPAEWMGVDFVPVGRASASRPSP